MLPHTHNHYNDLRFPCYVREKYCIIKEEVKKIRCVAYAWLMIIKRILYIQCVRVGELVAMLFSDALPFSMPSMICSRFYKREYKRHKANAEINGLIYFNVVLGLYSKKG